MLDFTIIIQIGSLSNMLPLKCVTLIFPFASSGSKQYSASIAFTLALFSHLVNHVNIRLQAELEEADVQVPPLHTDATGESALQEDLCMPFT